MCHWKSIRSVISAICYRESILPVSDGFRHTIFRDDGTVFGVSLSLFTPHYFLHSDPGEGWKWIQRGPKDTVFPLHNLKEKHDGVE
jgi:hypothetical protein